MPAQRTVILALAEPKARPLLTDDGSRVTRGCATAVPNAPALAVPRVYRVNPVLSVPKATILLMPETVRVFEALATGVPNTLAALTLPAPVSLAIVVRASVPKALAVLMPPAPVTGDTKVRLSVRLKNESPVALVVVPSSIRVAVRPAAPARLPPPSSRNTLSTMRSPSLNAVLVGVLVQVRAASVVPNSVRVPVLMVQKAGVTREPAAVYRYNSALKLPLSWVALSRPRRLNETVPETVAALIESVTKQTTVPPLVAVHWVAVVGGVTGPVSPVEALTKLAAAAPRTGFRVRVSSEPTLRAAAVERR